MQGCHVSSSISIFVNGSPSKEFTLQRGLRQGNPLASFLFTIVGEDLSGLMRETLSKGFKVGVKEVEVNLLQYADDIIFVGNLLKIIR